MNLLPRHAAVPALRSRQAVLCVKLMIGPHNRAERLVAIRPEFSIEIKESVARWEKARPRSTEDAVLISDDDANAEKSRRFPSMNGKVLLVQIEEGTGHA